MTPAKPTPQESGFRADSAFPTPGIAGVGEALGALRGPRHERGGLVVVRQLVGTSFGGLRHLVGTTLRQLKGTTWWGVFRGRCRRR